MQEFQHQTLSFGDFTLDLTRACLFQRDGKEVKLRPKSFEVLRHLVENSGRLVKKDDVMKTVWPDSFVTDDSLVQCLIEIRRALGDHSHRYIKTVPRRGYIFEAEVIRQEPVEQELVYSEEIESVHVAIEEEEHPQQIPNGDATVSLQSAAQVKLLPGKIRGRKLAKFLFLATLIPAMVVAAFFLVPRYFIKRNNADVPATGRWDTMRAIAVLPFANSSGNPDTDYLSDGISESLINSLSQVPGLKVTARISSFKYKGREIEPKEVANALGVEGIITGRVAQHGDTLLISIELTDTRDSTQLWGEQYNRKAADVLTVLPEISRDITEKLRLRLTPGEQEKLANQHTSNPEAYNYYAKAMYHFHNIRADLSTRPEADLAVDLLKQAIKLDPNYALAHARLGYALTRIAVFLENNPTLIDEAKKELVIAERIDPQLADVHVVRYFIAFSQYGGWQMGEAIRELRLAQQLDPNVGHSELGDLYIHIGLEKQAVEEHEIALKADPNNDEIKTFYINLFSISARPDEALAARQKFFNRGPGFGYYLEKRMVKEAEPLLEEAFHEEPRSAWALANQGLLLALQQKQQAAEAAVPSILKGRRNRGYHHVTYFLARIYALGGKPAEALKWLRVTTNEGFPCYPLFARDPFLDPIREDATFNEFMTEMKKRWEDYQREFG